MRQNSPQVMASLLGLALCLLVVGAACSLGTPTSTSVPATPTLGWPTLTSTPEPDPFPSPTPTIHGHNGDYTSAMEIDTRPFGAATASVSERIYVSDVIVVARMVSDSNGVLTFRAIEYLKGTGPNSFTVPSTSGRNTQWDNRNAILFLNTGSSSTTRGTDSVASRSGRSSGTTPTFQFADTTVSRVIEHYDK